MQDPPTPAQPTLHPRANGIVLLGVASWLVPFSGVVAFGVGLLMRHTILSSQGRYTGAGRATVGAIVGGIGAVVWAVLALTMN